MTTRHPAARRDRGGARRAGSRRGAVVSCGRGPARRRRHTGWPGQLDPAAFSFAGDAVAVIYEALRVKTAALVHAGATNLDAIAAALRSSAATYAAEDATGMHRLRGPS